MLLITSGFLNCSQHVIRHFVYFLESGSRNKLGKGDGSTETKPHAEAQGLDGSVTLVFQVQLFLLVAYFLICLGGTPC